MTDGMFIDFNIPLGLYNLVQQVIANTQHNPNTPQIATPPANRMWFSQPRTSTSSTQQITLYTVAGTGNSAQVGARNTGAAGFAAQVGSGVDADLYNWVPVAYPATLVFADSVAAGVDTLTNLIISTPGPFVMVGYSQGAVVVSQVLQQLQSGSLVNRMSDLVAGVTFGNPMREAGHTFPNGIDPGGHGIMDADSRLAGTPDLWWDFAVPQDLATTTGDDSVGTRLTSVFMNFYNNFVLGGNVALFLEGIAGLPDDVIAIFTAFAPFMMGPQGPRSPHSQYGVYTPLPGNTASCVDLAIQYLNDVGTNNQVTYNYPLNDVLTVNFKLPLSVSEIGFEALRVACHIELWYLDRLNNWRQVLDEARNPVTLDLSISQAQAWYTAHFYCYPFVAKSVQWRFLRVYDPMVGNQPYCVGMRNGLIRRNIYTRSDGTQGIEPQQDPIGNLFTSYIKDWDASKAIDDNPLTYWKSMPLPDPSAVVSLYLDVRGADGGPQLIDTLYLDPVYSGQVLNLYYSNDDTIGTLKLSPITAVATTDENTQWTQGKGRWDISNVGETSDYEFSMTWGPLVSQPAWIGIEWQPDFNPGYSSEVQLVTISGATGGTFMLSFEGDSTTALPYTATAAAVQAALAALPSIGSGNVAVTGLAGGPFTASFQNALGGTNLPVMGSSATGLTPPGATVTVNTLTDGGVAGGPPENPVLFEVLPPAPTTGQFVPTIYYDVGAGEIVVELTDGTTTQTYTAALSPLPAQYNTLRLVVGWCYDPTPAVFLSVKTPLGVELATTTPATNITVFELADTLIAYQEPDGTLTSDPTADWLHQGLAGNAMFTHVSVDYPAAAYPMTASINAGIANTISAIATTPGPFILVGTGQGADVIAGVYDEIRGGGLWSRASDFLGAVTFGNPRREQGHTFPGAPDPGGYGIDEDPLINTEPKWWDFVISGDPLAALGTSPYTGKNAQAMQNLWLKMQAPTWKGTAANLVSLMTNPPANVLDLASKLVATYLHNDPPYRNWFSYDPINLGPVATTGGQSCFDLALNYILSFASDPQTGLGAYLPADNLPTQISLDGSIGFHDFRGLFTAHVIKLEPWGVGQIGFQANPGVYVSPDPVIPDANGNIPATTLDNAIYAAAWATQEHGTGGCHSTNFEDKLWTPIWSNYIAQKGKLYFPQQISMKYLQLEFTNLTEEPYPVYDSGIQTSYQVFPVSVTQQTVTNLKWSSDGALTVGPDVQLRGIGSVNWLNPSTVNNAVNAVFGKTVNLVNVTTGLGFNTATLPNTTGTDVADQSRNEVSSPWVFKRTPPNTTTIAAQLISTATTGGAVQSGATALQGAAFAAAANVTNVTVAGSQQTNSLANPASAFSPALNFPSTLPTLPAQGSDWWVFPGSTLRLPATVMNGLTGLTGTVTGRGHTTTERPRFTTTCVHRYDIKTVARDSAVAYFAGVREATPYLTVYIANQDPAVFIFSQYSSAQWVWNNITALDSGPITTAGSLYQIINPNFDTDINNWEQTEGDWTWDGSLGYWYLGTATVIADGTEKQLVSTPMDVTEGVHLDASVWVTWAGLSATSGSQALTLTALYYNDDTFVSSQTVGLTYSPWPADTPETSGNTWAQIVAQLALDSNFLVPPGVTQMRLALMVTADATAGQVWFDTVVIGTTDLVEGTIFKDFSTQSTFVKLTCSFTDTGLVRSDDMWAQADPNDTNISSTALAYYTSTIPDAIPAGMWADTFADWGDARIVWGEPRAVVAIQVDPDRIFQGKRVLHFSRAGGAEEAGVKIRQNTFFVAGGLFRIGCIFFKPATNTNQVTIRLRRVSDGVYIHQESFDPVIGYWYEYISSFIEIPDSEDQQYSVELVCSGDDPDEFYLNDLYCEIAQIRYFVRLGDESQFLHDVTALRYAGLAIVSTTDPVQEFSVQAAVLSPHSYCYGGSFQPTYLK